MSKKSRGSTTKKYATILVGGIILGWLVGAGVLTSSTITDPGAMIDALTSALGL